jgi:acyl transferase domain-containing protein/acyl carrier protein
MNVNPSSIDLKNQLQKSLIAIKKLKEKLGEFEKAKDEPIAVVGMDCRFPKGNNPEKFWELLCNNQSGISETPLSRWDNDEYYDANVNAKGKIYTKHAGFIDQPEYFDAGFFGISPREALYMDPQQRILLEVCWHALENANISPADLYKSLTGIFIGLTNFDYASVIKNADKELNRYVVTGNVLCVAAGRISNALGLMGPCMAIDTSCSSSAVALHQACQSLRNKECNVALAGGANLIFSPQVNINLCEAKMLAVDGLCKTFDESANGYVRGEGCGIVVLKRLSDAIANNDTILACIKGSAINHDGPSGGLTVPNGSSQKEVIKQAMKNASVLSHDIDYIEAHGTGTPLGDPIELETIGAVVKDIEQKMKVGSVKTNIGHLEPAAGIAGLIKIILSLQNETIPAHLNLKNPNKYIPWNELAIDVVTQNTEWKKSDKKRIAGLSSFGFSGTNAHLIVEEGIDSKKIAYSNLSEPALLCLSAKSEEALNELIKLYIQFFHKNKNINFSDVCYTANTCRSHFKFRKAIVAISADEAINILAGNNIKNENNKRIDTIAKQYLDGEEINWVEFYKDAKYNKVALPNYPFQRQKYWIENNNTSTKRLNNKTDQENNSEIKNQNKAEELVQESISVLITKLKSALPNERYGILLHEIRTEVAKVMELPSAQLPDIEMGFVEMGIDSIMGIELKNKLQESLGYAISTTTLFNYPTINSLTKFLLAEIFIETEAAPEESKEISISSLENTMNEPIAIIGMGCRFPGDVNTPEEYWDLLKNGMEGIVEIPKDRWDSDAFYDSNPDTPGKMNTKCGGFIKDVDLFDPGFFGIVPREAITMDPQQRLLLEVCWEALENAGIVPEKLRESSTGVYVGIGQADYAHLEASMLNIEDINPYVATGGGLSFAAGRISYVLGLQGPCMAIDTTCSSSLVTIHMACQSLRLNECNLALAGGVQIILTPEVGVLLTKTRVLSTKGKCSAFSQEADGFVRGEGCGMIALKRLSDAIKDGDNIMALIRGGAVNHDGKSSGLTVPNGRSQQAVIRQALANAKLNPNDISYVEAHGTGTLLGDPIEVDALGQVFNTNRPKENPLLIGSVKTNIGHLESAAGIASLIKVVMALQHKKLPPSLNCSSLSEYIPWEKLSVKVVDQLTDWNVHNRSRIAGISSFGLSGTNAHIIVEEGIKNNKAIPSNGPEFSLLTLSAKSEEALKSQIALYIKFFNENKNANFSDVCFTANTCRSHFKNRLALIASSVNEAENILTKLKSDGFSNKIKVHVSMSALEDQGEISSPPEINSGQVLGRLGGLFISGEDINWLDFYKDFKFNKVKLPTYPFQRKRYWVETSAIKGKSISSLKESLKMKEKIQDTTLINNSDDSSVVVKINNQNAENINLLDQIKQLEIEEQKIFFINYLLDLGKHAMGLDPSEISTHKPLNQIGLDSLMAVELKNKIKLDTGIDINMLTFMGDTSINGLADEFIAQLNNNNENISKATTSEATTVTTLLGKKKETEQKAFDKVTDALVNVDNLTEAELDKLLNEMGN